MSDIKKIIHIFSHDLRNPLLNIQALTQEMNSTLQDVKEAQASHSQEDLNTILQEDLPDIVAMLHESTQRMDNMISGINDIYHCMYDVLECEAVDMQHMMRRCFDLLKLGDAGIVLQCDALPSVHADPLAVKRLVCALLDNAAKAIAVKNTDANAHIMLAQHIHVCCEAMDGFMVFEISDDGCGFLASEVKRVFEPFFAGQHFADGAGQGLALVKALVERHGGEVAVLASEVAGSKVCFSLPNSA